MNIFNFKIISSIKNKIKSFLYKNKDNFYSFKKKCIQILDTPIFIESFDNLYDKGIEAFGRKNYITAFKYFEKAHIQRPQDVKLCYNCALAAQKSELFDKAIRLYLKVLKMNPDDMDSHFNIALIYINNYRFQKAIEHLEKVVNQQNDEEAIITLAFAYAEEKMFDESLNIILKLVNPKNYKTLEHLFNLALIFESKPEVLLIPEYINFAITIYQKILIFDKSNYDAYFHLSLCYFKHCNYEQAANACYEALKIVPDSYEANVQMGEIMSLNDMPKESIKFFLTALDIDPKQDTNLYLQLSFAYEQMGEEQKAIKILQEATKIFDNSKDLTEIRNQLKRLIKL